MIPIKVQKFGTDPTLEDQIRPKKNPSLIDLRSKTWSKTWCGRQQLWKAVITGMRLQDSAFLSEVAVNHLKKARGEIWPKRSERRNHIKKDEGKKSAINKKNNSQIKSLIAK